MKTLMIASALTMGLFFAAPGAGAKQKCKCSGKHFAGALKKAGVTGETLEKVQALKAEKKAKNKEWKAQWRAKKGEVRAALAAATLDQAKIDGLAAELATLKGNQVKLKIEYKAKIAAALSAEQRATVFAAKKHKKRGKKACGCK